MGQVAEINLTDGGTTATATSATTASVAPASNALVLLSVCAYDSADDLTSVTPTITGGGMTTWDLVAVSFFDSTAADYSKVWVFRAQQATPTSGTIGISMGAVSVTRISWSVDQFAGATVGANGADAIVQSVTANGASAATSLTGTLAAFSDPNNIAFAAFGLQSSNPATFTSGSGFTELGKFNTSTSNAQLYTEYRLGDFDPSASWTATSIFKSGVVALEIGTAPTPTEPRLVREFSQAHSEVSGYNIPVPAAGCAAGNFLILTHVCSSTAIFISSLVDDKGNTWTVHQTLNDASNTLTIAIASCKITTALVSGDTIDLTFGAGGLGGSVHIMEWSGLNSTDHFDVSAGNINGFDPFWDGASVTPGQAKTLLIGLASTRDTTLIAGSSGGWSTIEHVPDNGTDCTHFVQARMVSSIAAYEATGTFSGDTTNSSITAAFIPASTVWTHEQTVGQLGDAPLAFTSPVKAGSLLIAILENEDGSVHDLPTDTLGNTWTPINTEYLSQRLSWWYAIANGAGSTTVTFDSTMGFDASKISEWSVSSGTITLDDDDIVYVPTAAAGIDSFASPSVAASAADSLALGIIATLNNDATIISPGTGYTMLNKTAINTSTLDTCGYEAKILPAAGSVQGTFTSSGATTLALVAVAVFKTATPVAGDQKSSALNNIIMSEPSLSSYFKFDEATGNFLDSKGSVVGNPGGGTGITYGVDPLVYEAPGNDYGIEFDNSVPGIINFGDVFDVANNTPFTFEFTIQPDVANIPSSGAFLFGKGFLGAGGGFWCDMWSNASAVTRDGCSIRFRRWQVGGGAGPEIYTANPWRPGEKHHVIITFNSSIDTIQCMIDGYLVGENSGVMTTSANAENFYIGAIQNSTSGGASSGYAGIIDNFAYYTNYMSEQRMREHYRAFLNPTKRVPIVHVQRDYIVDDYMRSEGYAGDRRSADGSYGMWYERGNLIANSGSGTQTNAETSTTGWDAQSCTITRDTTEHAFGTTSFKVDTNGGGVGEGMLTNPRVTVLASHAYAFSCWVKAPNAATLELCVQEFNSGGSLIGTETLDFTGTGNWQEVEIPAVMSGTADSVRLWVRTALSTQNINFYVGGLQLEDCEAPTSGLGRAWKSPYMGSEVSALVSSGRGAQRLLLYDGDIPVRFYDQGWVAFKWRQGFTSTSPADGENQGFFQRGSSSERFSMYSNGYSAFLHYWGTVGGAGDTVQYAEYDSWSGSSTPIVKGTILTGVAAWTTASQTATTEGNPFVSPYSPRARPDVKAAIPGLEFADIYGSYQWFGMRPESEVFWMIAGSGVPTDADSIALETLPNTPTRAQVIAALSRASQPALLYNSGNLFAEVLVPQTTYYSQRRYVSR